MASPLTHTPHPRQTRFPLTNPESRPRRLQAHGLRNPLGRVANPGPANIPSPTLGGLHNLQEAGGTLYKSTHFFLFWRTPFAIGSDSRTTGCSPSSEEAPTRRPRQLKLTLQSCRELRSAQWKMHTRPCT